MLWWVEGECEEITLPSEGVRSCGGGVASLSHGEPLQQVVATPDPVREEVAEDPTHLWDRQARPISPPPPA